MNSVENYVTGEQTKMQSTRSNRVRSMMKNKRNNKHHVSLVKPSLMNRILASSLFSNTAPLPVGSLKKTKVGGKRLANENLRALSELSYRSLNTVKLNLKTMKNKKNRQTLRKALNLTRRS
jgi:hypothetical protein